MPRSHHFRPLHKHCPDAHSKGATECSMSGVSLRTDMEPRARSPHSWRYSHFWVRHNDMRGVCVDRGQFWWRFKSDFLPSIFANSETPLSTPQCWLTDQSHLKAIQFRRSKACKVMQTATPGRSRPLQDNSTTDPNPSQFDFLTVLGSIWNPRIGNNPRSGGRDSKD